MTDKPFLERWSGRKNAARDAAPETAPPPAAADPEPSPAPLSHVAPPITEEELAALPPVETLAAGSDIRSFLRPGVPAALKNAALRRMWLVTPAIRDHKDIAVDYAWDWNTPGGVPGDGGQLDPKRVAQWVRELSGQDRPTPSPAASETAVQRSAPTPATPPEPSSAPAAEATQPPAEAPRSGQSTERTAARPRHGGARPA